MRPSCTTRKTIIGFALLSIFFSTMGLGQINTTRSKLGHLRKYAGQIPIDNTSRPRRNLFNLPELKSPLIKLLSAKGYRRLVDNFEAQSPIEIIAGEYRGGGRATIFLVMRAFNKRTGENSAVVIDLDDISPPVPIYVVFFLPGRNRHEWYSTKGNYMQLPNEIRNKLQQ